MNDPRPLPASVLAVLAGETDVAIVHGEALDLLARAAETVPEAFGALVTDPPYSSGGAFRSDRAQTTEAKYVGTDQAGLRASFSGDNRDQRSFAYWSALWLSAACRACRPGAPICLFSDWRQAPTASDALQAGGWVWRGLAVWDKTEGARPYKGRFRAQAEFIAWGSNGPMPAEGPVLPGVFRYPVTQADKHHQTGKPTPLLLDILRIVPPGAVILDPFAGSGTTLVAARMLGLRAVGFELLAHNVATTEARLAAAPRPLPPAAPAPQPRLPGTEAPPKETAAHG